MKVLLLGDSCEDEYIYGNCDRISPEAPVPVMNLGRVETKTGMAGNVCLNLQAFNLDITFLTNTEKIFEIVEGSSCPVFIDSKKSILPNKSNCYVKINDKEYSNLDERCHIDNLIITQGSEGCLFNRTLYPAEKVKVRDVVGAGDTFLSALVFGYLRYQDINKAIVLGNKAASIAVQQPGTYVLSQTDINGLLE